MLWQEPKDKSKKEKRHGISGAFLMGKVPCSENVKMQTTSEEKKIGKLFL